MPCRVEGARNREWVRMVEWVRSRVEWVRSREEWVRSRVEGVRSRSCLARYR